jgi:hypothetical protein
VQGLPKKFDQKKILKVIKKKFGMSWTALDALELPRSGSSDAGHELTTRL